MRRALPYVLALLLGMSAAALAACGGGGTRGGIPSASAGELKSQITDVGQAVDDGRCSDVPKQLRQVDARIDELPQTTDDQLVRALHDGADRLREVAVDECQPDDETETTTTETAPQEPTTTQTLPEEEPTETLPTETTEEPETTIPAEPPPPTPPPAPPPAPTPPPAPPTPPPVSPGGGVTPEIPPG